MTDLDRAEVERTLEEAQKSGKEAKISDWLEVPAGLALREVLWYYDILPSRRMEIYNMYLAEKKTLEEWLEVYKTSKDESDSRRLALHRIGRLKLDVSSWINLYESIPEGTDLSKVAYDKVKDTAEGSFEGWALVYDKSGADVKLQKMARLGMRGTAKSQEEWRMLYDRCPIGSDMQQQALLNVIEAAKEGEIRQTKKAENRSKDEIQAAQKGCTEWLAEYKEAGMESQVAETALMNMYMAADREEGEEKSSGAEAPEKKVTDNP